MTPKDIIVNEMTLNNKTNIMKIKFLTFVLLMSTITICAQTYFNLQGGTSLSNQADNTTMTYQVGLRYQITDFGIKGSFNQTDGLYHTFDSYTLSATYVPVEYMYVSAGYRYDNGRGWGGNRNGLNVSVNGLIPLNSYSRFIVSTDGTFTDFFRADIMLGLQLDFKLSKEKPNRFF